MLLKVEQWRTLKFRCCLQNRNGKPRRFHSIEFRNLTRCVNYEIDSDLERGGRVPNVRKFPSQSTFEILTMLTWFLDSVSLTYRHRNACHWHGHRRSSRGACFRIEGGSADRVRPLCSVHSATYSEGCCDNQRWRILHAKKTVTKTPATKLLPRIEQNTPVRGNQISLKRTNFELLEIK